MNVASQRVSMGTIIQGLQNFSNTTGSHIDSSGSEVHSLGTMSSQSASSIDISGGVGRFSDVQISGSVNVINASGSVAKFGNGAESYTHFESDGTMIMSGSALVWEDLIMPLTTTKIGANEKPDFDETNVGYLFPQNDTAEILYLIIQMPHSWAEGTTICPHLHWRQEEDAAAVFKLDYKWINMDADTSGSFQTHVLDKYEYTFTSGSIHQVSECLDFIDGTGKTISSVLTMKLYRDDDVYDGDALAYQFDIHYQRDSLGSREEYVK